MSESMWGYLFLVLGIAAAALLILFGSISTKNEQDYYFLKEITQNAMLDSVDEAAYKVGLTQEQVENINTIDCVSGKPGTIRIVTERFVENFARRFSEVATLDQEYRIEFYEIQECPAKVSLKVKSREDYTWVDKLFGGEDGGTAIIENSLSAILETKK